ncbi:hypothetical protein EDD16DRAFT_282465 [Pisolithus croceorrhizus]|nr:hypothetical protein EDD16DRAFT_282465 [Pisolithus croceorrhizus]
MDVRWCRLTCTMSCFQKTIGNSGLWYVAHALVSMISRVFSSVFICLFVLKVAFEMVLQTVQLILLFLGVWETVMTIYSGDQMTSTLVNTAIVGLVFSGPSAFCVQAFFIFRLHSFSQRKPLPIFCSILITIQLAFTLTISASSSEAIALQKWRGFIVSTLFIAIGADTTIAASMSYYLKGSKTGFRQTSRLIDRTVLYIVATGMVTSLTTLSAGITFYAVPNTFTWLVLGILEAGLYANSLLAALNARAWLARISCDPESVNDTGISIT